ncbi:MAG TPA: PASTA domain-containing protein, partial [Chitinophagaceae bacterium]|nr:PASTA domain-containing protein [Chitinophagaceae bacterium]
FITKRSLWLNILFAIVLLFLAMLIFLFSLTWITHHGKLLTIPSVTGKTISEARKQLEGQGFDVVIQDSLYIDTMAPLKVIKQIPDADDVVKINRTVYLTINRAVPPQVDMPNLVGLSYRSAAIVLKQYGLKIGDTSSRPDFAKNSVLNQLYNGQDIKPGTKITMASAVSLVLGAGIADVNMSVPDLVGLSYADAKVMMEGTGLAFGSRVFHPDVKDSLSAYIYKQSPGHLDEDRKVSRIHLGQMIDIWLQVEKPVKDSTAPRPPEAPAANNYQ